MDLSIQERVERRGGPGSSSTHSDGAIRNLQQEIVDKNKVKVE